MKMGFMLGLMGLVSFQVSAGTEGLPSKDSSWYKDNTVILAFSIGPAWCSPSVSQVIAVQPDIVKGYYDDGKSRVIPSGELFLARQRQLHNAIYAQYGIAVAYSGNAQMSGDIWEDNDPDFNNYYFKYSLNHTRVGAKVKLIVDSGYWAQPYISGGVYVAFNQAYDYSSTAKIPQELPAPFFASNTTSAFSYTAGAGLQKQIDEHWQLGLGYEFADFGKNHLNPAINQPSPSGIHLTHFYTHQGQVSITYVC